MKIKSHLTKITVALMCVLTLALGLFGIGAVDAFAAAPTPWDGTVDTAYAGGTGGGEGDPYQIASGSQLAYLAEQVNAGMTYEGKYFKLTADIDLGSREWTPIGVDSNNIFKGTFDGNGKTISNFSIETYSSTKRRLALFGYAEDAVIKNLTLNGAVNITYESNKGNPTVSSIVAHLSGEASRISNCINNADITLTGFENTSTTVGGIAASVYGVMDNCVNNGDILHDGNTQAVGGITQYNYAVIRNCVNTGNLSAPNAAGIAYSSNATVENCCNSGTVDAVLHAAGIVYNADGGSVTQNCYNLGMISETTYASGAIVGTISEGMEEPPMPELSTVDGIVRNCYYLSSSYTSAVGTDSRVQPVNCDSFADASDTVAYDGGSEVALPVALNNWIDAQAAPSNYLKWTASASENNGYPVFQVSHTHDGMDTVFTAWPSENSLPTESGAYYLTSDITLSSRVSFSNKDITICLNGHNIILGSNCIELKTKAVLTICDCKDEAEWGTVSSSIKNTVRGTVSVLESDAVLNLKSGKIVNADTGTRNWYSAVYVKQGTFNCMGGEVSTENHAAIINCASLNISGGKVYSTNFVAVKGDIDSTSIPCVIKVNGGTVSGKPAMMLGYNTLTEISGNADITASDLYAIVTNGTIKVSGGTISAKGGDSSSYVHALEVGKAATAIISGGNITSEERSALYLNDSKSYEAKVYLTGAPVLSGKTGDIEYSYGNIYATDENGENPYSGSPLEVVIYSGLNQTVILNTPIISNVSYENQSRFTLTGSTSRVLTLGTGDHADDLIFASMHTCNSKTHKALPTSGVVESGYYALYCNTFTTGNISIAEGATVNICLCGYTLEFMSSIENRGTLNIYDCKSSGKLNKASIKNSGVLSLSSLVTVSSATKAVDMESDTASLILNGNVKFAHTAADSYACDINLSGGTIDATGYTGGSIVITAAAAVKDKAAVIGVGNANADKFLVSSGSEIDSLLLVGTELVGHKHEYTGVNDVCSCGAYSIKIAGEAVYNNKLDIFGDGTAVYNPETKTLTLNNASIEATASGAAGIYADFDLKISLIGSSAVTSELGYAINAESIVFEGGSTALLQLVSEADSTYALLAAGNITVNGGNIKLKAQGENGASLSVSGNVILSSDYTVKDKEGNLLTKTGTEYGIEGTPSTYIIISAHTHAFASSFSDDADAHWYECLAEGCYETNNEDKNGYGLHSFTDYKCTVCNKYTFGEGTSENPYIVSTLAELKAAMASVQNDINYIKLDENIYDISECLEQPESYKPMHLDLNEYTLYFNGAAGSLKICGTATVTNGTIESQAEEGCMIYAEGEGADLTLSGLRISSYTYDFEVINAKGGKVTVDDCYIYATATGTSIVRVTKGGSNDVTVIINNVFLNGYTDTSVISFSDLGGSGAAECKLDGKEIAFDTEYAVYHTHKDADNDYICDYGEDYMFKGEGTESAPYEVANALQLSIAMNANGQIVHIKLTDNIDSDIGLYLNSQYNAGMLLDLNGKSLNILDGGALRIYETATIKNGTINNNTRDNIYVYYAEKFTVSDLTVNASASIAFYIDYTATDIENCIIKSDGDYALYISYSTVTAENVILEGASRAYFVRGGSSSFLLDGTSTSYTSNTEYHTHKDADSNCVCDMGKEEMHAYSSECDTVCNNDSAHTRTATGSTHSPEEDDGTCTTAICCSACGEVTTEAKSHTYDDPCKDTACNNAGCGVAQTLTSHTPEEDDGNCTTEIVCSKCGDVTTEAKSHIYDNPCKDTACNNAGCGVAQTLTAHISAEDDGDCTTPIACRICGDEAAAAKSHAYDNACDASCNNTGCTEGGRAITHSPENDDGDCTTEIKCSVCHAVTAEAASEHDFGAYVKDTEGHYRECGECDYSEAKTAHSFGEDNVCDICEYEKPLPAVPTYTVTVEGGSIDGEDASQIVVNENGSVTVNAAPAAEGKVFIGWSVNGEIVSTSASYTFGADADIVLTAVYEDAEPEDENTAVDPDKDEEDDKDGLSAGAIVAIVVASVCVLGLGAFAVVKFVIIKK